MHCWRAWSCADYAVSECAPCRCDAASVCRPLTALPSPPLDSTRHTTPRAITTHAPTHLCTHRTICCSSRAPLSAAGARPSAPHGLIAVRFRPSRVRRCAADSPAAAADERSRPTAPLQSARRRQAQPSIVANHMQPHAHTDPTHMDAHHKGRQRPRTDDDRERRAAVRLGSRCRSRSHCSGPLASRLHRSCSLDHN